MFGIIQNWLYFAISVGAFVFEVWALVDAMRHTNDAYYVAGKRNKAFWTAILGAAAAIGFLGLPYPLGWSFTSALGILGIAAIVAAGVYAAGVRPALRSVGGTKRARKDKTGGW